MVAYLQCTYGGILAYCWQGNKKVEYHRVQHNAHTGERGTPWERAPALEHHMVPHAHSRPHPFGDRD